MKKVTASTLDECIKYANLKAIYQTTYELFNLPEFLLKAQDITKVAKEVKVQKKESQEVLQR